MRADTSDSPASARRTWTFSVSGREAGRRLDKFLGSALASEGVSREKVKEWIKAGQALVDGRAWTSPSARLAGGETVELSGPDPAAGLAPEAGTLALLHQDPHLLVLDKPAGLTVHPAPGRPDGTLAHRLVHHFPRLAGLDAQRPGIVHRIDKDTSGLLAVALDEATRLALAKAFADRKVDKEYLALVWGRPDPDHGVVEFPLGRHPRHKTKMAVLDKGGRPAHSEYRTLYVGPDNRFSLLRVRIRTGRTHQIRVHLAHLGHPIVGDGLYGGRPDKADPLLRKLAGRQMLHAWRLGLDHPATGERLEFLCPPPKDFLRAALHLARRAQHVVVTGLPGCGKSSLAGLLAATGLPAWSADRAVAELYEPGCDGWSLIRSRFGPDMAPDGLPVDRKALLAAMLDEDAARREVMDLIHPLVFHRLEAFRRKHAGARATVAEVPLFLESASPKTGTDVLVGVRCPAPARRARLAERGWGQRVLDAMESWQWPEADKLRACGLVADNSGTTGDLERAALAVARALAFLRRQRARRLWRRLRGQLAGP